RSGTIARCVRAPTTAATTTAATTAATSWTNGSASVSVRRPTEIATSARATARPNPTASARTRISGCACVDTTARSRHRLSVCTPDLPLAAMPLEPLRGRNGEEHQIEREHLRAFTGEDPEVRDARESEDEDRSERQRGRDVRLSSDREDRVPHPSP